MRSQKSVTRYEATGYLKVQPQIEITVTSHADLCSKCEIIMILKYDPAVN